MTDAIRGGAGGLRRAAQGRGAGRHGSSEGGPGSAGSGGGVEPDGDGGRHSRARPSCPRRSWPGSPPAGPSLRRASGQGRGRGVRPRRGLRRRKKRGVGWPGLVSAASVNWLTTRRRARLRPAPGKSFILPALVLRRCAAWRSLRRGASPGGLFVAGHGAGEDQQAAADLADCGRPSTVTRGLRSRAGRTPSQLVSARPPRGLGRARATGAA